MKQCLLLFIFAAILTFEGVPSFAQTNTQTTNDAQKRSTQQTDQSEEAWRKSKKKRASIDPFDPFRNNSSTGVGSNLPPMRPMDMLPEASQRHLIKQRAKVIANMEFGDTPEAEEKNEKNAVYEPSEAAKKDPALAREEEAVWEIIVTDLRSNGTTQSPSATGPHKVAVVGRGGSQASPDARGGSAKSAAEIMAALKGLKPSTVGGAESNSVGKEPAGESQSSHQAGVENIKSGNSQSKTASQSGASDSDAGASSADSEAQLSSQNGQVGEENKKTSPQSLSPLSLPETTRISDDTECSQSSASAYLKHTQGNKNTCN